MPRSKTGVKRPARTNEEIKVLEKAANAVLQEKLPLRKAAILYGVPKSTLSRHLIKHRKNKVDRASNSDSEGTEEFVHEGTNKVWRVFTDEEEDALVAYLICSCRMHYGLSTKQVKCLAYDFAVAKNIRHPPSWDLNKTAGKHFYQTFMERHKDKISLRKPEATSLARSTAFNRATVKMFFDKLKLVMDKYHFTPERIYNLDETGVSTVHAPGKVVAPKGVKQVGAMTSGERGANITVISCVNAIGNAIPPMMIFPRVNFRDIMLKGAPPGTIGQAHKSGWSNGEKFLIFLRHLISQIKPSKEEPILLLLDNHESHATIEAVTLAKESGIVMLTFPPHTSHKLQPLDRTVFGSFKKYYGTACSEWMLSNGGKPLSIYNVAECVGKAYLLSFTPLNIQAGFRVSGIWPINENIFTDAEFLSSSVTDRPVVNSATSDTPTASTSSSNREIDSGRNGDISPADIRPFPKAAPRSSQRGGRKPGRCRILTDTPEKAEIENAAIARKRHAPKRCVKESTSLNKRRPTCRRLEMSDSDSTSGEVNFNSSENEESDSDSSHDETEKSPSPSLNRKESLSTGDFVITKLKGKKRVVNFIAKIINIDGDELIVQYLKRSGASDKFYYHDEKQYDIQASDVVKKLPIPVAVGGTERRCMQLEFDIPNIDELDIE